MGRGQWHFLENDMTDLLADANEFIAGRHERLQTHSDRCHLWHPVCMVARLAREVVRLRAALDAASGTTQEAAADPHGTSKSL